MWFATGAMNALFLSADLFNIYVTLELLGLSAVGLVALAGGAGPVFGGHALSTGSTLLGSGAYLLGVSLLYGVYGSVSLAALAPLIAADAPAAVSLGGGVDAAGVDAQDRTISLALLATARPRRRAGAGFGPAFGFGDQGLVLPHSAAVVRSFCANYPALRRRSCWVRWAPAP